MIEQSTHESTHLRPEVRTSGGRVSIEKSIQAAVGGDKSALERVVIAIQDNMYHLALRMLADPEAAKDATQDILIKVMNNLSTFQFKSQFNTWVHRIAVNHLISAKSILSRERGLSFELYQQDLESDLQSPAELKDQPEYPILLNELRISCTMAMLLCLKPAHRMVYILGEIYEMGHVEASEIMSVSRDNFRQQLSRARAKVQAFTSTSCGLINRCAKCSCDRKLTGALQRKRVSSETIYFANQQQFAYDEIKTALARTQQDLKTLALQQSINHYKCPSDLATMLESLVQDGVHANWLPMASN